MRLPHEKPDHIEEYLVTVRTGAWFSWSDINNKIYANLVVNDGGSKPTEKECIDGLASLQAEWDKNNADYVKKEEQPILVCKNNLICNILIALMVQQHGKMLLLK